MADTVSSRKRSNPPQPKKSPFKSRGVQIGIVILVLVVAVVAVWAVYPKISSNQNTSSHPVAVINTSMGVIRVELYQDKAPVTTANFIRLVNAGFYSDLVFHRVANLNTSAPNTHIIQGGGFYANGTYKQSPFGAITLETSSSLVHDDGAIAMARTNEPNSATSQFYICDGPQHFLDGSYAVFGKVMDDASLSVVRRIATVKTETRIVQGQNMTNWPATDVIINSITMQ